MASHFEDPADLKDDIDANHNEYTADNYRRNVNARSVILLFASHSH